ncbi:DUF512 domain-containing protein [Candidatus Magnetominusculus dajiuhuensis]|uniref:DUF512 domain-containing protein n=1 Tax=Candidatus Magnetominusculus dajiuhuensis TaxID=3137712 RepID=UPI003B439DB2
MASTIAAVIGGSLAHEAGLRTGDELISINGHAIADEIDLMFYSNDNEFSLLLKRRGKIFEKTITTAEGRSLGLELKSFKISICKNRCLFCFVNQLPKGLRKTLYIKDEDYRMSFLYGSYITLTNLSDADKQRIIEQRLSPLYISVHSTNEEIRKKLIGNAKAGDVLKEIRFLTKNKIKLHAQIVLCPGYNDGSDLEHTITDLRKFYPYLSSIAVVPVGLTVYGNKKMNPVTKEDAIMALSTIEAFQKKFLKKHGEQLVYAADELYLKGEHPFPPLKNYGELPQKENGVGMVPEFLHRAGKFKKLKHVPTTPISLFTGMSFYPYLKKLSEKLNKKAGVDLRVVPVENQFFGTTITVTGLLTGRDIVRSFMGQTRANEIIFIPDVTLRDGQNMFLDDTTTDFVEEALGVKTKIIESSFDGLIRAIEEVD